MPDIHYENPRLAAIYDLDSGWSDDRDFYLSLAAESPQRILDLGCGTGLLCDAYAERGHEVTGVDPSAAMLDVARRKRHGSRIEWVQSCAQTFESKKTFDLVIMTGHAFQVLLEDADVRNTFCSVKKLLNASGQFVFESRNPSIDWAGKWNYEMEIQLPHEKVIESRQFLSLENSRMTFELKYQFQDETLLSLSELRFSGPDEIETQVSAAGLKVEKILGDWVGGPFSSALSEEMIFVVKTEDVRLR